MAQSGVQVLEDATFEQEVLNADVPVLVDFWAPWCAPCRLIEPAVAQLATQYAGRAKFGKLNIDEQQAVAHKYNVMSIPTLLVFKGGRPVDQVVGAVPKNLIEEMVKRAL